MLAAAVSRVISRRFFLCPTHMDGPPVSQPSGSSTPAYIIYTLLFLAVTAAIAYMIWSNTRPKPPTRNVTQDPAATVGPLQPVGTVQAGTLQPMGSAS